MSTKFCVPAARKALAALALGFGLTSGAAPAQAVTVTVGGVDYEIETVFGTFNGLAASLEAQPWYLDDNGGYVGDLANDFALAVGDDLGSPNGTNRGPYFAFFYETSATYNFRTFTGGVTSSGLFDLDEEFTFARVADSTPIGAIPLPAGLPLMLVALGTLALVRRSGRKPA